MALSLDENTVGCFDDDDIETENNNESWPEADQELFTENDPEWKLSLRGMNLFLNNEWKQSNELFDKYMDTSILMCGGSVFIHVVQALMTFEDEMLETTIKFLHKTEVKCKNYKKESTREERMCMENLLAECYIYEAILSFIKQDLKSYLKGGWLLRKAWKNYEKLYKEISSLHKIVSDDQFAYLHTRKISYSSSNDEISPSQDINNEEIERLFGSVSFGYGLFQLVISLLPPKLLKIIQFLGFEGDESIGLNCIEDASKSGDVKAPIASLALLHYHTVIRPFFTLDEDIDAGVVEANDILEKCETQYPDSSLFLFFKGRCLRLQSKLDESLSTYEKALSLCSEQREIQLMCSYELGWVHLMKLNWTEAFSCFNRLKEESRWSKSYYAYMCAICSGILGNSKVALSIFSEVPSLIKHKNNQIEAFVLRRAERFKKKLPNQVLCTLLAFEILYLWNAICACEIATLDQMLIDCNAITEKSAFYLRSLVEGSIHTAKKENEVAIQCFREAIARHDGMETDYHVAAYAKFELGKILILDPMTYEDGKKHITEVKDSPKSFDFENRLSIRVHAVMKKLKEEGTPV